MAVQEVVVRLRAVGARAFQRDMTQSAKATSSLGQNAKTAAKEHAKAWSGAAAGAAAVGIGKVLKDSVQGAVDLGEQINKTAVVFRGPGARAVQDWSKTTATGIGISRQQALEAAGTFGNMLVPMGFARTQAAGMSSKMVDLAGDMASFNNASPEETLDAVRAGLAGETEPLRRFGVFLNDARIKQEAMSKGLWDGKGNMTAQAKAAATYSLILKDTSDAQGDFTRTSDSLANRQRVLRAQYANLTATIGAALLPALTLLANNIGPVAVVLGVLAAAFLAVQIASAAAALAMLGVTLPMALIVVGIVAVIAGLVLAYQKFAWFRTGVQAVWNWIKANWGRIAQMLIGPIGQAVVGVVRNFGRIKQGAADAAHWVAEKFRSLINFFKGLPGAIIGALGDIGSRIKDALNPGGILDKAASVAGHIPGLQRGGTIARGGLAVVGEAGPEVVALPRASSVIPSPAIAAGAVGGATTAHFYLDRRLIATAVAQADADTRARR